jgi:phosphoribosylanthranilate isomerase
MSARAKTDAVSHTQIKICGFTDADQALAAAKLGVDSIGLVFYPPSARFVSVEQAVEIARNLPPFLSLTALFLDAPREQVQAVLDAVPINLLQFHGSESGEFCESFGRPYIKSVAMGSIAAVEDYCTGFARARGFLLDSNRIGAAGGSGDTFDWSLIPSSLPAPVILAGGIDADNVGQAISTIRPGAVDISSGVESSRGVKDLAKMKRFVESVRQAEQQAFGH